MWSDYEREKKMSPEFAELEKQGFDTDRVYIKDGVIHPFFTSDRLLGMGFLPKGSKVHYLEEHGTPWDRDYATNAGIKKGDVFTVRKTTIGDWSSSYVFEEIAGSFNTVMFSR